MAVRRTFIIFPPGETAILVGTLLLLVLVACQGGPTATDSAAASGERAVSLAVDATNGTLLKVDRGLFRSTDHGAHWQPVALPPLLAVASLRQVVTSPAAATSLFISSRTAGILRSDDAGRSWRSLSRGLPSQDVVAFAVHSFRPDTLYAALAGQGVFRTEDGGSRWQKMDDGPPAAVVALNHSRYEGSMNTGWLYVASADGLYLSMDCF